VRTPRSIALSLLALSLAACPKKEDAEKKEPPPPPVVADATAAAAVADAAAPAAPQVITVDGFQTPESVLYDDQTGMYLVSNINGAPSAKDDNGFITRVSRAPEAKVVEAAWIDGKKPDVTLNAPKGMALLGDTLYVADLDTVRMFDRKSGAPKGEVKIKGAVFMNGLVAGDGVVYASDTGVNAKFEPGPAQAIYEIKDGKAKQLAKGADLGAPNGLAVKDGELWVVTFGSGELYKLKDGKRDAVEKLPKGQLDGFVIGPDGRFFITSWEGSTVFSGQPGNWTAGPTIKAPAGMGIDAEKSLLLVPLFQDNKIELHEIPRAAP